MMEEQILNEILAFGEWIDINGIRSNEHEWTWKGDNWRKKYSTDEMYNFFKTENIIKN